LAESKYGVVAQKITELLTPDTAEFEVPLFQREYSWGAAHITQLIEDVFDASGGDNLPYFLGSIVLAPKEGSTSDSDRTLILDGQQRLTTLSLIIAALGHKLSENGDKISATRMAERPLFSYEDEVDSPEAPLPTKVRLQPGDNRIAYETLLEDPSKYKEKVYRSTKIGQGMTEIFNTLEKRVDSSLPQNAQAEEYRAMLRKLLREVEIVKITAPSEGDAFRLFETLNDRGLDLSAADLIKNKLFQQASPRPRELDDCKEAWTNVVAATRDDDVVDFLRYYWVATRGFVRKQQLYTRYKNPISSQTPEQAGSLALNLYLAAHDYSQIINPRSGSKYRDPGIVDGLERLNMYRARSCRPVLLACSDSIAKHRESDLAKILQVCETITVRYSVVGDRNPNLLERIYSEMCEKLRNPDLPLSELFSTEPLSERIAEIPSDKEFRNTFQEIRVGNVTTQLRQLLYRLYYEAGTRETRPEGPHQVHVDHILPQHPSPEAFRESSLTSKEEASALIGRIGNLTLLSGDMNRSASNNSFLQKKPHYASSEFVLTRRLANYEKWGQDEIEARSKELADLAVRVYPEPQDILAG
jgi:hypothetical protein